MYTVRVRSTKYEFLRKIAPVEAEVQQKVYIVFR